MVNSLKNNNHIEIRSIINDEQRPKWSVVIPTYNCAKYLKDCLNSVLNQDPGLEQMEIIVVDDCSTEDNPKLVVDELGKDRIRFFQQKTNVGKSKNYATGLNMSRGRFVHLLHGDDTVDSGFYDQMEQLFAKVVGIVSSR